ncbi:MAG: hypothetical protein NC336_10375, partial [Clostridium sp.]|nr:hypothetical protein [Clostridium sp.]
MLNTSRFPGKRPEDATVWYGRVTELTGGSGLERKLRTVYEYDLGPVMAEWVEAGRPPHQAYDPITDIPRFVNVEEDNETVSISGENNITGLFGQPSHVSGYFREPESAEPLLTGKIQQRWVDGEWRNESVLRYHYRKVRTEEVAPSVFLEPLIFALMPTYTIRGPYQFQGAEDFNSFRLTAGAATWRCDSVIQTDTGADGRTRTIRIGSEWHDFSRAGNLPDAEFERDLRRTFGDTVCVAPTLPLLRSVSATCGGERIERHFLYGANIPRSGWFADHRPADGAQVASLWIYGSDRWLSRALFGEFTLEGGVQTLFPVAETFGRPDKTTSILHYVSYSPHGHPTQVARDRESGTLYYWGDPYDNTRKYDGDCLTQTGPRGCDIRTDYCHYPLVGCTEIRHPSGRTERYTYSAGRLAARYDTGWNLLSRWEYALSDDNPDNLNRRTTRRYTSPADCLQTDEYFDGFGLPFYTRSRRAGGAGEDVITGATFSDALDRPHRVYSPFPATEERIYNYEPTFYGAEEFYGDDRPYGETRCRAEGFGSTVETTAAGETMEGHSAVARQTFNAAASDPLYGCLRITLGGDGASPLSVADAPAGIYAVAESVDADGHRRLQFTDFRGRVVLDRTVCGSVSHDTYRVYDNLNQIRYVLPPELSAAVTSRSGCSPEDIARLGYSYTYSDSLLMTSKRLPGCEPETYIYDCARRLVLSQNGEQRKRREMTFRIYNHSGALAVTGLCDNADITWMQNGGYPALADYRGLEEITRGNTDSCGYWWQPILQNIRLLKVNYFNDYDFLNIPPMRKLREALDGTALTASRRAGTLTGKLTAVLGPDGPTGKYELTAFDYDTEERPSLSVTVSYDGTVERTASTYAYDGLPTETTHTVKRTLSSRSEQYRMTYDHARRPLMTTLSVDGAAPVTLSTNTYDAIGRQSSWRPGTESPVTFDYNVRGAVTSSASAHFSQTLSYETGGKAPSYNGNISRLEWTTGTFTPQTYDYIYDDADRLVGADHRRNDNGRDYSTTYTYDRNSNITSLTRRGPVAEGRYGTVDDLRMTYDGNRLTEVSDDAEEVLIENSSDFVDGSDLTDEMTYDDNGNLTRDLNRGITLIRYNTIGLPAEIHVDSICRMTFTYDADGRLLSRSEITGLFKLPNLPNYPLIPTLKSFRNQLGDRVTLPTTTTTRYVGSQTWSGQTLDRIETEAGYFKQDTLFATYRDYQGNIRAVVADGQIRQITHYYPYGLPWTETTGQTANLRKYSGKEFYTTFGLNTYNFE